MFRIAYVNGRYLRHDHALVHVEDRGFQFADGIYEVCAVVGGALVDAGPHLDRLDRSLREVRMPWPMSRSAMLSVMREVVRRNRVRDGSIYLQITRGAARREFAFPPDAVQSVVMTARQTSHNKSLALAEIGVKVISLPDVRWARRDIKSVALLPNVLSKQQAKQAGAYEAWLVDPDGYVTEGSSSNAWIVDRDGNIVTRSVSNAILSGITRWAVLEVARAAGVAVVERKFSVAEAQAAREAFLTSSTSFVLPIVQIDEEIVGNGHPGPMSGQLRQLFAQHVAKETGANLARTGL